MKNHIQRIQFYTRKAAQYSRKRQRDPHRYQRLMAYKAEMDRRLTAEGYRWVAAI